MTIRVQIPVYADYWMRGDRYGELVKTSTKAVGVNGEADKFGVRQIAHVKLDKSGKTIKVLLDDCQWVSE